MEVKKVTYEEALARFKRSLEIKRNAERRMAEEFKQMGLSPNRHMRYPIPQMVILFLLPLLVSII